MTKKELFQNIESFINKDFQNENITVFFGTDFISIELTENSDNHPTEDDTQIEDNGRIITVIEDN